MSGKRSKRGRARRSRRDAAPRSDAGQSVQPGPAGESGIDGRPGRGSTLAILAFTIAAAVMVTAAGHRAGLAPLWLAPAGASVPAIVSRASESPVDGVEAGQLGEAGQLSEAVPLGAPPAAAGAPSVAPPPPSWGPWRAPGDSLLGFVRVEGGPFPMGSDPAADPLAFDNEVRTDAAREPVVVPTFYMARTEVTVGQFRAFVSATGFAADPAALAGPDAHPVANVSWTDAMAFARWLDGALRAADDLPTPLTRLVEDGWRVALPSEAAWEKAARGVDGRIFPWGSDPDPGRANYGSTGVLPVASLACAECVYGLSDMIGNVWEWTRSPFLPGPYRTAMSPAELEADALWVMRGGSYQDPVRNARAAVRGGAAPGARRPFIGFRVALTRSAPSAEADPQ